MESKVGVFASADPGEAPRLRESVANDKVTIPTIEALTEIWQRVLQRPHIDPTDKFFELGGTDLLADRIFAEIATVFGRELPSATIYRAPTIGTLGALLEQPALLQFPPFVPLKAGNGTTPILIAHGIGGRASFSELARHIRTEHPIYGIQAKGVDGLEEPLESIEDMASFYLDALKKLHTQGPHILIGYSFGGLIALEMAQRLSKDGQRVALLALVDTYPDPRYFPASQRLWLTLKRINGHLSNLTRLPTRGAVSYFIAGFRRRLHVAGARASSPPAAETPRLSSRLSFAQTIPRVRHSDFIALKRYRPQFYAGKIKFVRPEANSYLPNNPIALWKPLAAELEIETVPGDHLGMIGTHFESLATVLTRFVQEAAGKD